MYLKTVNCVECGKPATIWHGYVIGKEKRALGYVPIKVIAGHCESHKYIESEGGNYGNYEPDLHGKCIQLRL